MYFHFLVKKQVNNSCCSIFFCLILKRALCIFRRCFFCSFPAAIELLAKVPLLQSLEAFSLASITSSSEPDERPRTLLEWITAQVCRFEFVKNLLVSFQLQFINTNTQTDRHTHMHSQIHTLGNFKILCVESSGIGF